MARMLGNGSHTDPTTVDTGHATFPHLIQGVLLGNLCFIGGGLAIYSKVSQTKQSSSSGFMCEPSSLTLIARVSDCLREGQK